MNVAYVAMFPAGATMPARSCVGGERRVRVGRRRGGERELIIRLAGSCSRCFAEGDGCRDLMHCRQEPVMRTAAGMRLTVPPLLIEFASSITRHPLSLRSCPRSCSSSGSVARLR
jgi:hypothetical protein